MMCPLLIAQAYRREDATCVREECAVWDKYRMCCGLRNDPGVAAHLRDIDVTLSDIEHNMRNRND